MMIVYNKHSIIVVLDTRTDGVFVFQRLLGTFYKMATLLEKKMRDLERARAGVYDQLHVQCVHFNTYFLVYHIN